MKSSVEQINPVQYRVNVELTPDEVNSVYDDVYRTIQRKARIQGFRPGKAPLNIIKKLYSGQVISEVHEKLVNKHLFAALEQETIRPIASPVLETGNAPVADKAFNFSAVVDTMPKLDFDDYKGLAVDSQTFTVKDATVDREVELLRRRRAKSRPVEAGTRAAKGMVAAISHTAAADGVDLPNFRVEDMTVQLGAGELFADLESALTGMGIGETKEADITLPEDYNDPEYAGKTLRFSLKVSDLKHLDVPELNDDFAKEMNYEDKAALLADVKSRLEARAKDLARQRLEGAMLDRILEAHPFEVPPAMVDQVIDSMVGELQFPNDEERRKALADKGLREHFLPQARRRTQNTLILWHVSQREKLAVTDAEVKAKVDEVLKSFPSGDPKQAARLRQSFESRLRENLIFEKAMDFLIQNAKINEKASEY